MLYPITVTDVILPITISNVICQVNGVKRNKDGFYTGVSTVWFQLYQEESTPLKIYGDNNKLVHIHYILTIGY